MKHWIACTAKTHRTQKNETVTTSRLMSAVSIARASRFSACGVSTYYCTLSTLIGLGFAFSNIRNITQHTKSKRRSPVQFRQLHNNIRRPQALFRYRSITLPVQNSCVQQTMANCQFQIFPVSTNSFWEQKSFRTCTRKATRCLCSTHLLPAALQSIVYTKMSKITCEVVKFNSFNIINFSVSHEVKNSSGSRRR